MVGDQFVNVARQRNSGVDVELNLRHDLGNAGRLSFTAGMTFQTKDDFQLLPTSPTTSDNGESGSPKWVGDFRATRSEEHTSELQSLMRISYAVFCLKKKKQNNNESKTKFIRQHKYNDAQSQLII